MVAVKFLYNKAKEELDKAGISDPAFNSMCLIEKVFNVNKAQLMAENITADDKKGAEFLTLLGRRLSGEPLQYILGEWEFYGYKFKVGKGVLIPRDDTEVLLRLSLDFLKDKQNARVLDLCSGSGALAVAIAKETDAEVYALEKSAEALPYLCENININKANIEVIAGDVFYCADEFMDKSFDLIISNPPYIITDEIDTLQKEISFEPKTALDGGADGLKFYRGIIKDYTSKLRSGGMIAFEIGEGQFEDVKTLMENADVKNIDYKLDLGGIQRVVFGTVD
ncbi:MAG: peptide chain release factor N(5)-glutamine methyltransferase [Ruminococcus sp.]|nr:peptide chain release factor N(5)-glutamine methyltransferase [Ruminococcus sp.]